MNTTAKILVLNAGSSSVKFELYKLETDKPVQLFHGQFEGIGVKPQLLANAPDGTSIERRVFTKETIPDPGTAIRELDRWLHQHLDGETLSAVGHRVVHGGPQYAQPVFIDDQVYADLEQYVPLAPLHQPNNLAAIKAVKESWPELPQVACFDTAFHRGHSELADHYAIPEELHDAGIRRYGFHGLSYEYIASVLPDVAPEIADGLVIVAHLGSGVSMCAMHRRKSVDSTMGFTALDGLPMGTRPGQLDPGVVLYLLAHEKMSVDELEHFLYHECGLKGLSGVSNDVRALLESNEPRAKFALEFFTWRIAKEMGALATVLGGLDAIVFTAGVGENAPQIRNDVCERLAWLGVRINERANAIGDERISAAGSKPAVYVIPTDEELMIAVHTVETIGAEKLLKNKKGSV